VDPRLVSPGSPIERDRELLRRWRDGDSTAGLTLLECYRPLFLRVCARFSCQEAEVLETHQDVCVRLLERLRDLPELVQTSFAGYLAWQTRDAIQRRREREERMPVATAELPEPTTSDPEPGTWEAIELCARGLPPREREVFELRYLLELSLAEIAERLGSNSNAVSQCVFRLVRKMRDCLRARGFDMAE
jgi:RNA polymerase sigma-70 factor (ECF subfamily)